MTMNMNNVCNDLCYWMCVPYQIIEKIPFDFEMPGVELENDVHYFVFYDNRIDVRWWIGYMIMIYIFTLSQIILFNSKSLWIWGVFLIKSKHKPILEVHKIFIEVLVYSRQWVHCIMRCFIRSQWCINWKLPQINSSCDFNLWETQ